jgi:hypothetical protein
VYSGDAFLAEGSDATGGGSARNAGGTSKSASAGERLRKLPDRAWREGSADEPKRASLGRASRASGIRSRLARSAGRRLEALPRAAGEAAFSSRAPDAAERPLAEGAAPPAAAATDAPGPGHQPTSSRAGSTVRGTPKRRRADEGGGGAGGALPQGAGVTATVRGSTVVGARATMRPRTSPSPSGGRTATTPRGGGRTVTTPRG